MDENLKRFQRKIVTEIVNETKLKKYDFRNNMFLCSYDNPLSMYLSGKLPLTEGLIMTHKPETVKRHLCDYLGAEPHWVKISNSNGVPIIVIDVPDVEDNVAIVDKAMDFYGYFKSQTGTITWNPGFLRVHYEPKNQEETLKQMNLLYHITPERYVSKIKQIGLCPKHKNQRFYYPERIYLFSDDAPMSYIESLKQIFASMNNDDKYVMLTIDRRLLGERVSLHEDPNCPYGYWTDENIPPEAIIEING